MRKPETYAQKAEMLKREMMYNYKSEKQAAPTSFDVNSIQIEVMDKAEKVYNAELSKKADGENKNVYTKIRLELPIAREREMFSIRLDNESAQMNYSYRVDIYLTSLRYVQAYKKEDRVVLDFSRAIMINNKQRQYMRPDLVLLQKKVELGLDRWQFGIKLEKDSGFFEQVPKINEVLLAFGLAIIEEPFLLKEITSKQEAEVLHYESEFKKNPVEKLKQLKALAFPKFHQKVGASHFCPLYTCDFRAAAPDDLAAHVKAEHKSLALMDLTVAPDGAISFKDEFNLHVGVLELLFKDFIRDRVLRSGQAKLDKLQSKKP